MLIITITMLILHPLTIFSGANPDNCNYIDELIIPKKDADSLLKALLSKIKSSENK